MLDHNRQGRVNRRAGRALLSNVSGSQVAEAALVLPLAFMMLLGIFWFGRAFNIYATINHAVQQGVRAGVAQTCATCGNAYIFPITGANIITAAMAASSVDPGQIRVYGTMSPTLCPPLGAFPGGCTQKNNITMCNNVLLSPPAAAGPPACGVTASFQYPYQFWLPFTSLNNQQIMLTVDVQMKGEY